MFGTRWRLFRLLGIPISLDASWLIILALLTWTLIDLFREAVPDLPVVTSWAMGLGAALAFFTCIVLHELGHALIARAVGIPIRGITLFLFGGVAEMEDEPPSASSEFLMAVAGPAVSAVLAGIFWLLSGLVEAPAVVFPLRYLAGINLAVLIFNLVPAFPLDGGRVLRSILWGALRNLRRATYWAALSGQAFAWLLIGLGLLNFFAGHVFQGIWLGLIGMFLNNAARGSYQQVLVRQVLRGEPVSRFMTREPIVVPPVLDLRGWVEDYVYRYHRKMFPVASDGRVEGVISTQALARFPREEWDKHTVAEAMRQDVNALSVAPNADALEALGRMQRTGSSRLLVTEGDRLVGIVSLKDLLRFLDLKLELEDGEGYSSPIAMLNIRAILVAADFSRCSEDAFRVARALARDYRARLIVLHVAIPPPFVTPGELQRVLQRPDGYRAELEGRLRLVYAADSPAGVKYRVQDGDPAVEILGVARETRCDLIVMGTHGRTGLGRLLMGSVAEKVVRKAPCPILTVKAPLPSVHPRITVISGQPSGLS